MKQLVRLKPGHCLQLDSYRRARPINTRILSTSIIAAFIFLFSWAYGSSLSRFVSDAASYQSAPKPQGCPIDVR